jgi:capsid assembly protease
MKNLSLLGQNLLNQPLCCSDSHALLLAAVFAGKLDIGAVIDSHRAQEIGRPELQQMQQQGRINADAKRAKRARGPWGELIEGEYFKRSKDGRIAVIEVQGTLTRTWGAESYSGTTGYDGIKMSFDDAIRDDDIRLIWFDCDTPGGSTNGMMDLAKYIGAHNREATGKLTIGYAGDYAYSAGYATISGCDRIYVPETGGVGSIGTIALVLSYAEALKTEGVDARVLRYPDEKALSHWSEPINESYMLDLYEEMKEITHIFQAMVASHRGIDQNAVAETRGRTYRGERAKAIGLVDAVLPEPLAWAAAEEFVKADGGRDV